MDCNPNDTDDKILLATITLMTKKGIKATTTRAIAVEAGVNEVTLFRHFGNKAGLMKAAVEKFSNVPSMTKAFKEKITWDLEKDLLAFCEAYHDVLTINQDVIIISFKEVDVLPELEQEIAKIPRQLKILLVEYFNAMQEKGKMISTNTEAQAMNFIWMNFGFFISRARFGDNVTELTSDEMIKNCVQLFARGLTP
ncbi:TetR/AcrR family transcriptional regulator [Aneurinibacillus terranovensis]|uniref:TetR/AcrR family transcriptional regulator n=1 Tax=Aneurinibacillus terranovensis TaxID=278991 RepID=UPI0003FAD1A7|nr:TetR/AcrR family transcriptional regulator [Aneurinibacillus terranovensis]